MMNRSKMMMGWMKIGEEPEKGWTEGIRYGV